MMALKRVNNEIKKSSNLSNFPPYEITWLNVYDRSDIISCKISIDICNKSILIIEIPKTYPFTPPLLYLNYRVKNKRYIDFCGYVTQVINKRTFLSSYDLQLAWLFSLNFSNPVKNYSHNNIPNSIPINCFCCNTITCYHNWNPGFTVRDAIYEFFFTKNLLFYTSQVGIKYINQIFNNDKWTIPQDIVLHILKFIY